MHHCTNNVGGHGALHPDGGFYPEGCEWVCGLTEGHLAECRAFKCRAPVYTGDATPVGAKHKSRVQF